MLFLAQVVEKVPEVNPIRDAGIWFQVVLQLGALGILLYILKYTVPMLDDRFGKLLETFTKSLAEQREHDATQCKYEREQCGQHNERVVRMVEAGNVTTQNLLQNMRTDQAIIMSVFQEQKRRLLRTEDRQDKADEERSDGGR